MSTVKPFQTYFSKRALRQFYMERIQFNTSVGLDRITRDTFSKALDENVRVISKKAIEGTYRFSRYRQILISKGRGKEPRVISIPTIRDKLALGAYHRFLQDRFGGIIEQAHLHTVIHDITQDVLTSKFNGFVKVDITRFYSSINHEILLKKVHRKIRSTASVSFLVNAISADTIDPSSSDHQKGKNERGVPEGLSISNILADIYLSGLKEKICGKYSVSFYRYVDDVLILCGESEAEKIKNDCISILKCDYGRSDNWNDEQREAYRILNAAYNQLSILTYDHLLMRAKNVLGVIDDSMDEEDGELPF